jgi:hypothetical protein
MRVRSLAELDALVGEHVVCEKPECYWEDCHGYFQFHSELEAREALKDPYYQKFLPPLDWARTVIREVRVYRKYTAEPTANWLLAERAIGEFGPMLVWRESGRWHAAFGTFPDADARSPLVAVCLASLSARGLRFEVDHNALDTQLRRAEAAESSAAPKPHPAAST